jgi:hypothetical protein
MLLRRAFREVTTAISAMAKRPFASKSNKMKMISNDNPDITKGETLGRKSSGGNENL